MRLKARERELAVFCDALAMLKSAAAYTAGDLRSLLLLCGENAFLSTVSHGGELPAAWREAAARYFTNRADRALASSFIEGYGKEDLSGHLAYISLFETRAAAAHAEAAGQAKEKGKLFAAFGLFFGTAAVLILL